MLDALEAVHIGIAYKGDGLAIAIGTGGTTDTVYVILAIRWYIVVDNQSDIVDINTTGHNIGSHQHIGLSGLKAVHHLVALGLREVGVHLVAVNVHRLQFAGNLLYTLLLTREDDDALQVAFLKDVLYNLNLLWLVAHVSHLVNLLGGL